VEREEGRGKREEGRGKREEGRGKREEGRGKREEGRGKREERRGKREEGRGKREEGRGKREEGEEEGRVIPQIPEALAPSLSTTASPKSAMLMYHCGVSAIPRVTKIFEKIRTIVSRKISDDRSKIFTFCVSR
jgi:hypothetical protein